jgi:hypothetical protein
MRMSKWSKWRRARCDYAPLVDGCNLIIYYPLYNQSKKVKKEKEEIAVSLEDLSPIAQPLAQKKLLKKLHKTIKKGVFYCE